MELGIESLELGCGNWSKASHVQIDELLESVIKREQFMDAINKRGLSIAALNCSGNQLNPSEEGALHKEGVEKTFQLAGLLGVETVVMMSGCPGGGPNDQTPNWLTHPILPQHFDMLEWQWSEVALPYWEKAVKSAKEYGVQKIAVENLGYNLVHNAETLLKLRREVVKSVVGETLKQYITRIKLEQAAFALKYWDEKIINILADLDFKNSATFSRAFKKKYNMIPKNFKEQPIHIKTDINVENSYNPFADTAH